MKRLLIALFCFVSINVHAQEVTDTTKKNLGDTIKKDLFTAPDTVQKLHSKAWAYVPPMVLIAYGALSFPVHPIRQFDYFIHDNVDEHYPTFHSVAESYFQFAPVAAVYALNFAGIQGKNRFIDRTLILGVAAAYLTGSTRITKKATHRLRPNGEDYVSFPSGHTATAFMAAEFLAQEYSFKSPWYGIAGYAVAAATGVFRIGNRDHWFSDTVAGAGYGILSTKLAYLTYPYIRNFLTKEGKKGKSTVLMPTYQDGMPGLYFTMQL
jgi:membrane-associated phospholipid phosphatase